MVYEVHETQGILTTAETPYAESTPVSGPRHFTIHPNNEYAYSAEELSSIVAVYNINLSTGALDEIQRVST